MQIAKHKVVSIDYTLTSSDGAVLDSSEGKEPLSYLHGVGQIIPGLEKAADAKKLEEEMEVLEVPVPGRLLFAIILPVPRQWISSQSPHGTSGSFTSS